MHGRIVSLQLADDLQHLDQFVPGIDKQLSGQNFFSARHHKQRLKDLVGMAHKLDQVFAIRAILALKPVLDRAFTGAGIAPLPF